MFLIASKRKSLGRASSAQPLLNGHPYGNDSGRLNGTNYLKEHFAYWSPNWSGRLIGDPGIEVYVKKPQLSGHLLNGHPN